MKQVLLVRHAKSSWSSPALSDFDRPLNDRGKGDAPNMARRLQDRGILPDLLVSSPANRALTTARYFADCFAIKHADILQVPALYHAPLQQFYDTLAQLPNRGADETIALFSHNPGITLFVNDLGLARLDNMPTCAIFGFSARTDDWQYLAEAEKQFLFFDYPKMVR